MIRRIPFRKKIAFELFRKYRHNSVIIHQLNYIFWECTLRCNLNCLHCGSDCKQSSTVKDMPVDDFINAIDDIRHIVDPNKTTIVFTGGEPLLRSDLEICGRKLYERGFPWGTVTNGFALNGKRLDSLLKAGLRSVTVSLDGMEGSHNFLRCNRYSFERAVNAIKMLAACPDLIFDVVTCVNQKNFQELDRIKELLTGLGVKQWRLFTIFPTGRAADSDILQLPPLQFRSLFEFIKNERKKGDIKINYGCEGFLGDYEGEVRDNFFFCRAGINVASVLADGSVSACPNIRHRYIQGNIYRESFSDIWQQRFQVMRNRAWMKTDNCGSCKFFRYCNGNGFHLRDDNGKLMFCHLERIEMGEMQA